MSVEYDALNKLIESTRHGVDDHYTESINDKVVMDIKFQTGGTATTEKNGVFIEDLIIVARAKLGEFQQEFPCRENAVALTKLDEAIHWLHHRKEERTSRGVYGKEES